MSFTWLEGCLGTCTETQIWGAQAVDWYWGHCVAAPRYSIQFAPRQLLTEWLEAFNDAVSQYLVASQQTPHTLSGPLTQPCQQPEQSVPVPLQHVLSRPEIMEKKGWCQLFRQPFRRGVTPEGRLWINISAVSSINFSLANEAHWLNLWISSKRLQ